MNESIWSLGWGLRIYRCPILRNCHRRKNEECLLFASFWKWSWKYKIPNESIKIRMRRNVVPFRLPKRPAPTWTRCNTTSLISSASPLAWWQGAAEDCFGTQCHHSLAEIYLTDFTQSSWYNEHRFLDYMVTFTHSVQQISTITILGISIKSCTW